MEVIKRWVDMAKTSFNWILYNIKQELVETRDYYTDMSLGTLSNQQCSYKILLKYGYGVESSKL